MLNKNAVWRLIIRILVSCYLGLMVLGGLWCLADSPKKPTPSTGEDQNRNLKTIPFFASTDFQKVNVHLNIPDPIDGLNIGLTTTARVEMGGRKYPAGVAVEGIGDLLRIYPKDPITINGIKICGHLGQHAQTLEIFEIKLCEDSDIIGVKIPGGSKVTFIPHKSRAGQDWFDISCINPGARMEYRGVSFKKGEKLLTLSKTFRPEDSDDGASECEVNVWDREMIEPLKKSGMIK